MSVINDESSVAISPEPGLGEAGAGGTEEIKTFKRRWLMLVLLGLASAMNAVLWITFSPVNSQTQEFFGVGYAEVNALSIVFLGAYVPMSFVSSLVFNKWGIRIGMNIAVGLNLLSGLLRWLSTKDNETARENGYVILLVGQTLGAIAQPFFTNLPTTLGAVWFPNSERDIAVTLTALFNPIGIAVGSVVPTLYVYDNNDKVNMFDLLLLEFIMMAVTFLLVLVLFKEKPPLPPSVSESHKKHSTLMQDMKKIFTNKDFMILFVCFGTGLGFFNALTTLTEQLIKPSGYTSDDAGLFSGMLIGCGLLSAIAVGILMDRFHHYNYFLKIGFALAGVLSIVFVLMIRPNNSTGLAIIFGLLGAVMLPLLPVTFECGVECTFPISEDVTTGAIMSAGQITGIVFIFLLGYLIDQQPTYTEYVFEPTYIVTVLVVLLPCVGIQFYNGKYLRQEAELEH